VLKKTLYFGNPAYLSTREEQMELRLPQVEKNSTLPPVIRMEASRRFPIEDLGVVILDHPQIVITQALMTKLLANNVALITCDHRHIPTGLMLNLEGHLLQSARFKAQIESSLPLRKQLWQQTVSAKIRNQATVLRNLGHETGNMENWAEQVRSGDPDNLEARAAVYYWRKLFHFIPEFSRDPQGAYPNPLLNYTYAILRAIVARSLVGSGLLPTLGIHHHNQYNHYCLADDVMEPYRPFADALVHSIVKEWSGTMEELRPGIKQQLLSISSIDVELDGQKSPLFVAAQRTTASLARCFEGVQKKILYPKWP
jgi:CRISP-associated protein Cas1